MKINIYIIFLFFFSLKINAQNLKFNEQNDPEYPQYLNDLFDEAYYYELSNPDSALITYDIILDISKKEVNNDFFMARANFKKGVVYCDMGLYDSSTVYFNKSIKGYKKINRKEKVALNTIYLGNVFRYKGEYSNAIPYYLNGISIYEELKDLWGLSFGYGELAPVFEILGQQELAKINYLESILYSEKLGDSLQLVHNYYKLSNLYLEKMQNDSAFLYLNKAKLSLNKNSGDHLRHLVSYGEGMYYSNIGDSKKAIKKAKKALVYEKKAVDTYYKTLTQLLIGKIYLQQGNLKSSLDYTLRAFESTKIINSKSTLIKVYSQLSEIYKIKDEKDKALIYKELESETRKLVLNEKQRENINTLNIKYETEKKEREIIQQQLLLEQNKNEIQKKKIQNYYLISLVLFLLVAGFLLTYIFIQRQKRIEREIEVLKRKNTIKTLESLIEGEEKERMRIARELHDGLNGYLSAIKFKLSNLLELNTVEVEEAITMIDNSCNQVRAISHNLIPPSLENFNLLNAVEEYCEKLSSSFSKTINFQYFGNSFEISNKEEINIFRIIQELVNNSLKHAESTVINVQISCRNGSMQVTVEDNGKGFDIDNVESKGIGLKNIQSRVEYLCGSMDILSNNEGTSTTIEIEKNIIDDD